jgi:hypothetical protein
MSWIRNTAGKFLIFQERFVAAFKFIAKLSNVGFGIIGHRVEVLEFVPESSEEAH